MFDRDTLIVSYDVERGDPRGTRARDADLKAANLGHCIDCKLCVHVCPTGIDIRDGLQSDCIACTACIDACDTVMDKMHYPRGLIRYATENGLERHLSRAQMLRRVLRPRVLIYFAVLVLLSGAFVTSLALRSPVRVDVVRDRASLARLVDDGQVENVYRVQLMNATERPLALKLSVAGLDGARIVAAPVTTVAPAEAHWLTLQVRVPYDSVQRAGPGAHPIRFEVGPADQAAPLVTEKSTFIIPR
jgi:cytochrome c oxidase accessory protein FixG